MLRAVLFDLGDTLWQMPIPIERGHLHTLVARAVTRTLDGHGLPAGWDAVCFAADLHTAMEAALESAHHGNLAAPDGPAILERVASRHGLTLDPDLRDALWQAAFIHPDSLGRQVYPDAAETLAWLRGHGYAVGVVSNRWFGGPLLAAELQSAGLAAYVTAAVCSCDCGWLKPHPEIFARALAALDVPAGDALLVGDSPLADLQPAAMLGMRTCWKRNGSRLHPLPPGLHPDHRIDDLREIRWLPYFFARREAGALPAASAVPDETAEERR